MKKYYEFSIKAFGKDNINKRYDFLLKEINDFILSRNITSSVTIDKSILKEMVVDYFSDTRRIKEFLNVTADKNVSSYLAYWIMRKKPLSLINKHDYLTRMKKPFLEYVNEWLAFHLILKMKYKHTGLKMFIDI